MSSLKNIYNRLRTESDKVSYDHNNAVVSYVSEEYSIESISGCNGKKIRISYEGRNFEIPVNNNIALYELIYGLIHKTVSIRAADDRRIEINGWKHEVPAVNPSRLSIPLLLTGGILSVLLCAFSICFAAFMSEHGVKAGMVFFIVCAVIFFIGSLAAFITCNFCFEKSKGVMVLADTITRIPNLPSSDEQNKLIGYVENALKADTYKITRKPVSSPLPVTSSKIGGTYYGDVPKTSSTHSILGFIGQINLEDLCLKFPDENRIPKHGILQFWSESDYQDSWLVTRIVGSETVSENKPIEQKGQEYEIVFERCKRPVSAKSNTATKMMFEAAEKFGIELDPTLLYSEIKEYMHLEEEYFLPPDSIDGGYMGLIHFSPAFSTNPDLIKRNCINIYIKPEDLFSGDTSDVKYRND